MDFANIEVTYGNCGDLKLLKYQSSTSSQLISVREYHRKIGV